MINMITNSGIQAFNSQISTGVRFVVTEARLFSTALASSAASAAKLTYEDLPTNYITATLCAVTPSKVSSGTETDKLAIDFDFEFHGSVVYRSIAVIGRNYQTIRALTTSTYHSGDIIFYNEKYYKCNSIDGYDYVVGLALDLSKFYEVTVDKADFLDGDWVSANDDIVLAYVTVYDSSAAVPAGMQVTYKARIFTEAHAVGADVAVYDKFSVDGIDEYESGALLALAEISDDLRAMRDIVSRNSPLTSAQTSSSGGGSEPVETYFDKVDTHLEMKSGIVGIKVENNPADESYAVNKKYVDTINTKYITPESSYITTETSWGYEVSAQKMVMITPIDLWSATSIFEVFVDWSVDTPEQMYGHIFIYTASMPEEIKQKFQLSLKTGDAANPIVYPKWAGERIAELEPNKVYEFSLFNDVVMGVGYELGSGNPVNDDIVAPV